MRMIGIDTGGTFTDLVLWQDGSVRAHKVLSTPEAPERAILQGIADLGLDDDGLVVIHGSTVATNAVLEGKGASAVYVCDRGLEDLLAVGRQARPALYDLQPPPRLAPVPRERCLGIGGRLGADGRTLVPLVQADIGRLLALLRRLDPESVAVNLLFSYLDDAAERAIADAVPAGVFVSRSCEVLPIAGEYERGVATWLNARVGPVVARYLERLGRGLPRARISVMQSSGEAIAAEQTARHAVRMLLSGPAGGLAGAAYMAAGDRERRILSFDMGGTSTDVAVVDGEPGLSTEGRIAGLPVALPMVDMHTIGAGGGSIARLDAGGLLLVGPKSAGADPGPACYGRGGSEVTVTDANLVLGRLDPLGFLGGRMALDVDAARAALAPLARGMSMTIEDAALGVVRIANEHMAQALRVITVERGLDPRELVLTSFGGAGPLHVCALADALGIRRALVPEHAGVLSALGMLVAPAGRTLVHSHVAPLTAGQGPALDDALDSLVGQGLDALRSEGVDPDSVQISRSVDLRYPGQSYTLNLPWQGVSDTAESFHREHLAAYGHRMDLGVEIVSLRVRVRAPATRLAMPELTGDPGATDLVPRSQRAHGVGAAVKVFKRAALADRGKDAVLPGPAVVADEVATTWVAPGWEAELDAIGNLWLTWRGGACADVAGAGQGNSV